MKNWWKEGIVYQIYPRSFNDSNNDGIGDLQGIVEKLDYLEELGITILWLNPVYASPNDDNGYDISDYQDIMAEFGTMKDWEVLLHGLHQRGIRLIMDLVVNHTSDEHAWFIESRKSKSNPYRDYYMWAPPAGDGGYPNNWQSFFQGPAWEYDENTGEYYLHLFSKKQPDLNWENPKLRDEIYSMMRFWLDKGIDGFRMDVINMISKTPGLPSATPEEQRHKSTAVRHYVNGPKVHEYLQEMHKQALAGYDVMTVGECPFVDTELAKLYVGKDRKELDMIFQMEIVNIDFDPTGERFSVEPWKLQDLKELTEKWQKGLHGVGWNSLFWMNHDQPRSVSRFGNDIQYRREAAKMLVTYLMTLEGTPYIYQGEEIGMTNYPFQSIEEFKDIDSVNVYNAAVDQGKDPEAVLKMLCYRSRDNARTPMQWDDTENAGFSQATPWMPVNPNYKEVNLALEREHENSIFRYFQEVIRLRKNTPALVYGSFETLDRGNPGSFTFIRKYKEGKYLIMLNFTGNRNEVSLPKELFEHKWELFISNYPSVVHKTLLSPFEARVYRIY
ncbi:MAG: glycoside hydrolase family 13 protein [Spirochaetia bacterium]